MTAAGVDGCKAGWVCVARGQGDLLEARVYGTFADLLARLPADAIVAVDMPIGLPDRAGPGGRGAEVAVRRVLSGRQSSVFSIPSRAAVYAEPGPFAGEEARYAAHRRASAVARGTSDPPRGISIQAFGIFGKIREIDGLLRERPELRERVLESHPEAVFWQLNGRRPMSRPKKIKGRVNEDGMTERRDLLVRCGLSRPLLEGPPPRGAAADDLLDACAMLLVAERRRRGEAFSFPDPPGRDAHGLPIAIWV